jgi:uncharacterized DUF497 family protein
VSIFLYVHFRQCASHTTRPRTSATSANAACRSTQLLTSSSRRLSTPWISKRDYGETRFVAVGLLAERLHVVCFTEEPDGIRVISFRKANAREVKRHAKVQNDD